MPQKIFSIIIIILILVQSSYSQQLRISPEDEKLYGRSVNKVFIKIREIFDESTNLATFYKLGNKLKINSLKRVVKQELLFKKGDKISNLLLVESARNLRSLRFFRHIEFDLEENGDMVDVYVTLQDTWTIIPQASYSSGDGVSKSLIGIAESNFLGRGKRIEALYREDEDRESVELIYNDPRLFGTNYELLVAAFDRSDGEVGKFVFGVPFRTVFDKYSWHINLDFGDTIERLFENNEERFIYRQEKVQASLLYAFALGKPEERVQRISFGYSYNDYRFDRATLADLPSVGLEPGEVDLNQDILADDRIFSGPVLNYEYLVPDYIYMNYIDRFDRVQDFNLGSRYLLGLQYAPKFLGSIEDSIIANTSISRGYKFSDTSFTRAEIALSTRYNNEGVENSLLRFEANYYNVLGLFKPFNFYAGRHTLATRFLLEYGMDLDQDRELLTGGDNAIRGYQARSFTGDKRFAINIEDRIHLYEDVLKLVSVGAAVFIEAGGSTYDSLGELLQDEVYSNVGAGLRLIFPRSSGSKILRVDISLPLRDGPDGSDRFEPRLIFSAGQIFDALLPSERGGSNTVTTSSGIGK